MVPAAGLLSICVPGGKRTGKMTDDLVLQDNVSEPMYLQQQDSSTSAATNFSILPKPVCF
jgi:hypothetical protein